MKLGFIGCGNMASAIIAGIVNKNTISASDIFAYDIYSPATEKASAVLGMNVCIDENEVILKSDIVFLAVKPNVISSVLEKIDSALAEKKPLIISIAAGKTLEFLQNCISNDIRLVRVMPNINAKVGEAISAYCCNENVTETDIKNLEMLLSCFGKCLALDEKQFPVFGVIGGCAPAFAYMFIDAIARSGVQNGMKKDQALKIAAQTVYGSAKMILESDEHPWRLIDNVCSPGGTTIEGVTSLQKDGFEGAVNNAVNKAIEKDKKL